MRPVSTRFLDAVVRSHRMVAQATVYEATGGGVPDTQVGDPLEIIDGQVTLDITAATRGRCDLTLRVDDVPTTPDHPLAPYGNEIHVQRGIQYSDGTVELVSLGRFRIERTDVSEDQGATIVRVAGSDRSARLIDNRFRFGTGIETGYDYDEALEAVLTQGWPDVPLSLTTMGGTTPQLVIEEASDRWQFAQTMAADKGCHLYFDGDGQCVNPAVAQVGDRAPDQQLVEGDNGLLVTANSTWSREGTYNRVIATGENTSEVPVRAEAYDGNPLSPTYVFGPFGDVVRWYSSPFITTDDQAQSAAEAILSQQLGTTKQVDFGTIVNPALEPNDIVRITSAATGIDEDHVIDTLTIGLTADSLMTGRTRAVQVT